jgi:hypothetical protein
MEDVRVFAVTQPAMESKENLSDETDYNLLSKWECGGEIKYT